MRKKKIKCICIDVHKKYESDDMERLTVCLTRSKNCEIIF